MYRRSSCHMLVMPLIPSRARPGDGRRSGGILYTASRSPVPGGHAPPGPDDRTASLDDADGGQMPTATDINWDPLDEDIDDDPHPVWRRMRDEAPLYRNDHYDFWALSRYADVEAAHRDPATFSSASGTVLEMMGSDLSGSGQIIFMDPPSHTILRALVSRAFTPRRMAQLDDDIRDICAGLLDPLVGRDEFDFVQDFA